MGGTAGVADSQGIGSTGVPWTSAQMVPALPLSAPLLIWFQVSFPQLLSQAIPEETGIFPSRPWVSNRRSGGNGLRILARSKLLLSSILMALLWVILKVL